MEIADLRRKLLGSKKTERIIFAATPELKSALETAARDRCVSASSYITDAIIGALAKDVDSGGKGAGR